MSVRIAEGHVEVTTEDNTAEGRESIGSTMGKWAAGLGIGALISAGINNNLDISAGQAKLVAQLDLTGQAAENAGRVAGEIFRTGIVDNMGEAQDAVRAVGNNLVDLNSAPADQVQALGQKALTLAKTFDIDVNEATRAAGQMVKNGMAPDFDTAFDMITRGFQTGGDASGDFLDTINEYSPQFSKIGIDGSSAFGMLSAASALGVRDADSVADAIKEFGLVAIDTADGTTQAYQDIGLNADQMRQAIAGGGPAAADAMSQVVRSLMSIQDPVEQNRLGVAFFGTTWEDTARQILPALDPLANQLTNVEGATQRAGDANTTAADKVQAMKNEMTLLLNGATNLPGPLGTAAAMVAGFGADALAVIAPMGGMVAAMAAQRAAAAASAAANGGSAAATSSGWIASSLTSIGAWARMAAASTVSALRTSGAWLLSTGVGAASAVVSTSLAVGRIVAGWVLMGAQSLLQAARMAAAWVIAMGPVGWVIAAVVGLVALIIANWDSVVNFTRQAWSAVVAFITSTWRNIMSGVGAAVAWVRSIVDGAWQALRSATSAAWSSISAAISAVWRTISSIVSGAVNSVINFVRGAWNTAVSLTTGAWSSLRNAVSSGISGVVGFVSGLPGRIVSSLGNLGGLLLGSGRALVDGFLRGIRAAWDSVVGFVRNGMQTLRNLWPFSPAKEGPFSGRGYVTYSGAALTNDFAASLRAGLPGVADAASAVLGAAQGGLSGGLAVGVAGAGMAAGTPAPANQGRGMGDVNVYVQQTSGSPAETGRFVSLALRSV